MWQESHFQYRKCSIMNMTIGSMWLDGSSSTLSNKRSTCQELLAGQVGLTSSKHYPPIPILSLSTHPDCQDHPKAIKGLLPGHRKPKLDIGKTKVFQNGFKLEYFISHLVVMSPQSSNSSSIVITKEITTHTKHIFCARHSMKCIYSFANSHNSRNRCFFPQFTDGNLREMTWNV